MIKRQPNPNQSAVGMSNLRNFNELDAKFIDLVKVHHALPVVEAIITGKSDEIDKSSGKNLVNTIHNLPRVQKKLDLVRDGQFAQRVKKSVLKRLKNFSMSEELAQAIGVVVVQALQENAKNETEVDEDLFDDEDIDDENTGDLPESSKDAGTVDGVEAPKPAPDLSEEFSNLKNSISNHSVQRNRYERVKDFLTL